MNTTPDLLNRGLWGVMATPFTGESLAVDEQGLRNLIDLYREAGAQGLVLLGVFGEGAQLDDAESARIVEIALEHAPGMRLVLGLPDLKTDTAIARATRLLAVCGETKPALMVQVNTNDVDWWCAGTNASAMTIAAVTTTCTHTETSLSHITKRTAKELTSPASTSSPRNIANSEKSSLTQSSRNSHTQ